MVSLCYEVFASTYVPKSPPSSYRLSAVAISVKDILAEISLVFGIGMCMVGIYRYTLYRKNPLYYPFGTVLSMILSGAALIGLYFIPIAKI